MTLIAPTIHEYFTAYMTNQRRMSPNTIAAYRDTCRLLLSFASERHHVAVHQLHLEHLDAPTVEAFLDHLEHDRGNAPSTRNARLAAVNSLAARAARAHPEYCQTAAAIASIPTKKTDKPAVTFLTDIEAQTLIDAPPDTPTGRRDRAMLALACQTGLRVAEIAALTLGDIQTRGAAPHVASLGKGRKHRTTPITKALAEHLDAYLAERRQRPGDALFPNPQGHHMSADAIRHRLALHLQTAAKKCPTLNNKHITMHTLRHTAAIRFLHAGIDTAVIALWLGHENIATTGVYLQASLTLKQAALDRTRQPDTPPGPYQPDDPLLTWLQAL